MHKNSSVTDNPSRKQSESIKVTLDDSLPKKCQTCQKGFMLRRKVTCCICQSVFCSDHCTKKRHLPFTNDFSPICDSCNEEETKKEIIEEINKEILRVSEQVENIKEHNDKLFKEHYNNTASLNNLEMEIKKQEWNAKKQEEQLLGQLENEQGRGRSLSTTVDILRKALDESSRNEKNLSDACIEADGENDIFKVQMASLTEQNQELVAQIEKIQEDLKGSLGIEQIRNILCNKCLAVVNESLNSKQDIDIGPGDSVSLVSYSADRPSKQCVLS